MSCLYVVRLAAMHVSGVCGSYVFRWASLLVVMCESFVQLGDQVALVPVINIGLFRAQVGVLYYLRLLLKTIYNATSRRRQPV